MIARRSLVLTLYRNILRTSRAFIIPHPQMMDKTWGTVLAASARAEIEGNRWATDPEEISLLLTTGNDALQQIQEKVGF